MVGNGLILLFNDLLRLDQKDEILLTVLEAFKFVLDKAEYNIETDQNPYVEIVFNIGMVDKLELMQEHQNSKIYDLSVSVIQSHFDLEDDF
jgi:importin subunit alpha-1